MTNYAESVRRLQAIVPIVFEALQHGLDMAVSEHDTANLRRRADQHYFSHTARRHAAEYLRERSLLVTDLGGQRSALAMSGLQIQYNGVNLWLFRASKDIPLPTSERKQRFYRQERTLDDWDNLLLLWSDVDGRLADPLHLVRPVGGDRYRRNLLVEWTGPLTTTMATMRAEDLNGLRPDHDWRKLGGDERT